jgi:hypothetical protein
LATPFVHRLIERQTVPLIDGMSVSDFTPDV